MALDKAAAAVAELYKFRDHYFETHPIEDAPKKTSDIQNLLTTTLEILDTVKDEDNKAQYLLMRGKSLNVLQPHNQEAQELLSRAVKLDPNLVEAWIQLGECYWKKNDFDAAKNCFLGALNHGKDKVALRSLSMVLRQLGKNPDERKTLIEEGVEKAREAITIDPGDGTSWFILGNAYLSLFFTNNQNPKYLKQCLGAYHQAEQDVTSKNNPDLHFNKATVVKYQEDYQQALELFARAAALDPSWEEPKVMRDRLLQYLTRVDGLLKNKGKIRAKKLRSMCESLKDSDLGPFAGGSYTGARGDTFTLRHVPFEELQPGVNEGKVVMGKVVCSITTEEPVPFTFCMVDKAETCVAVTLYNITPGYGVKIGDSVAVAEPYLQAIDISDQVMSYRSIRVDSPVVLVVNGRKQGLDRQAPTVLTLNTLNK